MNPFNAATSEVKQKVTTVREVLRRTNHAGVRFRGVDWFAWCTGGGFGGVLMTSETAVADILITQDECLIITDVIERERLRNEVVPKEFTVIGFPWQRPWMREQYIAYRCRGKICSDRPAAPETALPIALVEARSRLTAEEIARYRTLGSEAAEAITEVVREVSPDLTELDMASRVSFELQRRGIDATLVQVGGEARVEKYRHVLPTRLRLGRRAMIAICARRGGLYASLTRFLFFDHPSPNETLAHDCVARIESAALNASHPHASLARIYAHLATAYSDAGFPDQIHQHHQGGTTGYLARECFALPDATTVLSDSSAVAWNPSLPGAKIEDTFLCNSGGLEVLTLDHRWPSFECNGRRRPAVMVLA